MILKYALIPLLGVAALSELAMADVLAARTRSNPFSFEPTASGVLLPTNDTGSTRLTFVTTRANQRVVITYNAECSVTNIAGNNDVFLGTDIIVDRGTSRAIIASPTVSDNALCTSDDVPGGDFVSVTSMGVAVIPVAGTHTVTVVGNITGGGAGDFAGVDDTTLVVQD